MEITNDVRAIVTKGLRDNGMSQAELAKKLGVNRSWMTKFFNGALKRLSDDYFFKIQDTLGVSLTTVSRVTMSTLAIQLANQIEKDSRIEKAFSEILGVMMDDHYYDLPLLPTRDLVDFGKEIVRASHENPDKPGKVGKIALTWLALRLKKISEDNK